MGTECLFNHSYTDVLNILWSHGMIVGNSQYIYLANMALLKWITDCRAFLVSLRLSCVL